MRKELIKEMFEVIGTINELYITERIEDDPTKPIQDLIYASKLIGSYKNGFRGLAAFDYEIRDWEKVNFENLSDDGPGEFHYVCLDFGDHSKLPLPVFFYGSGYPLQNKIVEIIKKDEQYLSLIVEIESIYYKKYHMLQHRLSAMVGDELTKVRFLGKSYDGESPNYYLERADVIDTTFEVTLVDKQIVNFKKERTGKHWELGCIGYGDEIITDFVHAHKADINAMSVDEIITAKIEIVSVDQVS